MNIHYLYNHSVQYGDNFTTQAIPLAITTTFVYTSSQKLQGYSPPAPPVLFRVPYDVFYPFYESNTASSRNTIPNNLMSWIVIVSISVTCSLLCCI